jgi:hypothetical protein
MGEVKLVSGMPVETFIQTDETTVISYLLLFAEAGERPIGTRVSREIVCGPITC